MDGGDHNPFRLKQMQGVAHARDVGHRVQSPHLVVVDVAHRAAVGLGLRHRNRIVYRPRVLLDRIGQRQSVDDLRDMPRRGMVVRMGVGMFVRMGMVMPVRVAVAVPGGGFMFLLAVHRDAHMGPGDPAGGPGHGFQVYAGQTQAVHRV